VANVTTSAGTAVLAALINRLSPEQQQRHRWLRATPNFQPDDLILMMEDITTSLQWPTAVTNTIHLRWH